MKLLMFTICISLLNSCYFFREDKVDSGEDKTSPSGVIGGTITSAGGADTAELTALYAISPAEEARLQLGLIQIHISLIFSLNTEKEILALQE